MNCQRAREIFPELLDGRNLPGQGVGEQALHLEEARRHLAACPECQREFATLSQTATALDTMPTPQPSPRLRSNFYAMLEEEKHSAPSGLAPRPFLERRPPIWRWVVSPLVAAALLFLGFALGRRSPPPVASPTTATDDSTKHELIALRSQMDQQRDQLAKQNAQLEKMTTLVGYSILQQQQNPANERLQEVLVAAREPEPKPKVIDDLIKVLTLDPSANVRLRAIEALYPHAEREVVRAGVLAALPREQNPLVQLELIDFVAAAQDHNATPVLETIAADESTNGTVREAAKLVLAQL